MRPSLSRGNPQKTQGLHFHWSAAALPCAVRAGGEYLTPWELGSEAENKGALLR